jgi:Flp pilus assembly protein TadG
VEFALMLPLAFALVFAVIEYSYYFGAIHYTNYATFAGARALQANAEFSPGQSWAGQLALPLVKSALLNGNVTRDAGLKGLEKGEDAVRGSLPDAVRGFLPWEASTPGFKSVMGDLMDVEMTVVLGRPECNYEGKTIADHSYVLDFDPIHPGRGIKADKYTDNGLKCSGDIIP